MSIRFTVTNIHSFHISPLFYTVDFSVNDFPNTLAKLPDNAIAVIKEAARVRNGMPYPLSDGLFSFFPPIELIFVIYNLMSRSFRVLK